MAGPPGAPLAVSQRVGEIRTGEVERRCKSECDCCEERNPDGEAEDAQGDHDLIHTDWGPAFASHPTWPDWFEAAGIKRTPKAGEGHRVGLSSLALDFAAEGMGVALGQSLLARRDLEAGRLISPFGPSLPLRPSSCLASPREKARRPKVQALVAWLKDRVPE